MSRKAKTTLTTVAVLSTLYAALSALGVAGIESGTGGVIYRLIIIAALLLSCSRAFAGAGRGGALLAGALGLGAFAVFEIYSFAYIYLYGGSPADLTVGNYTRNCAYLFFMAAALYLIPPVFKAHKAIRAVLGVGSSVALGFIFYAIIASNYPLLAYSALAITVLCLLSAVVLIKHSRLFAISIIVVCLLGTASRLLLMTDYNMGWHLRDTLISLYPAAYLLIGYALTRLRKEAANNE